ncbi:iron complex transport system ATP-binding protein [Dysgonomonadaceae bacterium PH5-43]|nr:iron complex transport system ATP-binding protein [Dysgonomonadaceae bacterium PH5-43]
MERNTIHINNLTIGYKTKGVDKIIGKNLSSSINSKELTCLIGANGVGKSTLLRTLSGFQPPISGEITLNNKSINNYSNKELSKLVGVVLTEKVEVRDMSVFELVSMGRNPYTSFWGKLSGSDIAIINEAISLVNITDLTKRSIQTLSDGERQKAMIAKALAQQTPIIFLDEPTAFLDFPSKVEIMQLLHTLSKTTDKTIFLSTHDLELALQIADTIWIMDKTKGLVVGSPNQLSEDGSIDNIFNRKGVSYDRNNKMFRIEK